MDELYKAALDEHNSKKVMPTLSQLGPFHVYKFMLSADQIKHVGTWTNKAVMADGARVQEGPPEACASSARPVKKSRLCEAKSLVDSFFQ